MLSLVNKGITLVFSTFFILIQMIFPITPDFVGGEDKYLYDWDSNMTYSSDVYAQTIVKDPDEDFVILNITDVQLNSLDPFGLFGEVADRVIDELIERTQPDLITMTGDNAWGATAYIKIIEKIESFGIPWAPIMGNHDGELTISEFWAAYQLYNAENCLFEFGPKDMGYGNYIINIEENGEVIHTLFMMDTHSSTDKECGGYDHLWDNQIEWYKWAVKGITKENGKIIDSSVFIHIPVPEFIDAWESIHDENGNMIEPYKSQEFCTKYEGGGYPSFNNGFFDVCKELGSTKNIVAGHDHVNCFTIDYEGINLTYSMKTGIASSYRPNTVGGTTITIDSQGNSTTNHESVDISSFLDE